MAMWGFVSDVHGNLRALQRALDLLRGEGANHIACLGDVLGRGDADACARLLRETAEVAVVGNRDRDWRSRVSIDSREWVDTLPTVATVDGLLLAHGDPRLTRDVSTAQVGRDFREAWKRMEAEGAWLLAFGHSHQARLWRKQDAQEPAELLGLEATAVEGDRYVLNVGTTGLPFPGKGGPSVALVDATRRIVRLLPLP